MKKNFVFLIVLLLIFTGCGASEESLQTTETVQAVQPANPWVSYDTLQQAEKAVGFSFSAPEEIGTFRAETFRVMNGQLLEVCYCDGDFEIMVRKQLGEWQDISGVYEAFETETAYETGDSYIIGRLFGQGILNLVYGDGYSWSIYAPDGCPDEDYQSVLDVVIGQTPFWLREANEAFNATIRENGGGTRASELSCFFSCTWSSPEEIDLAEFLRYCPLGEQIPDETTGEAQAVIAAMGENPFLVTPVWRYSKEAVSTLLCQYTGITVDDLLSREGVLYLEAYDAFYNCTSDWGPGRFQCTGGEQSGNQITLWGAGNGGEARTLTLREENGEYIFMSYLDSGE